MKDADSLLLGVSNIESISLTVDVVYIKNIEDSAKENDEVKEEKLIKIYEAAKIEIPEMIKRNL